MSQHDGHEEDGATMDAAGQQAAERDTDGNEGDVEGHRYTGALRDKNQQP